MYSSSVSCSSGSFYLNTSFFSSNLALQEENTSSSSSSSNSLSVKNSFQESSQSPLVQKKLDAIKIEQLLDRCIKSGICNAQGKISEDLHGNFTYKFTEISGNGFQKMKSNIESALDSPQIAILPFYEKGSNIHLTTVAVSYTRKEVLQFLMRKKEELGITDVQFVGSFCSKKIIDTEAFQACVRQITKEMVSPEEVEQKGYFVDSKEPGDCDIRITTFKDPALITESILLFLNEKISKQDQNTLRCFGINSSRALFQAQLKSKKNVISEENTFAMVGFLSPIEEIPTEFICVKTSKKSHRLTQDCFKVSIFDYLQSNKLSEVVMDTAPFGAQAFFDLFFDAVTPSAYDTENWSRALFLNKRFLNAEDEEGLIGTVLKELEFFQTDQEKASHLFSIVKRDIEKIVFWKEKIDFACRIMESLHSYSHLSNAFFCFFLQKILQNALDQRDSPDRHPMIDLLLNKHIPYGVAISYLSFMHLSQSSSVLKWGNGHVFKGTIPFSHTLKIDLEKHLELLYSYFSETKNPALLINHPFLKEDICGAFCQEYNVITLLQKGKIGSLEQCVFHLKRLTDPQMPLKVQALALSTLLALGECPNTIYYFSSLLEFFSVKKAKRLLRRLSTLLKSQPDLNGVNFFSQISPEGPYAVFLWITHHYFDKNILKERDEKQIVQAIEKELSGLSLQEQIKRLSHLIKESVDTEGILEKSPFFFVRLSFSLYSYGTFSEKFLEALLKMEDNPSIRGLLQKKSSSKLIFELLSFFHFTEHLSSLDGKIGENLFSLTSRFLSAPNQLKLLHDKDSSFQNCPFVETLKKWAVEKQIISSEKAVICFEKQSGWVVGLRSLVLPGFPSAIRTSAFKALIYLEENITDVIIPHFLDLFPLFPEEEQKKLLKMAIQTSEKSSFVELHSFLSRFLETQDFSLSLIKTGKKEWIDWILQNNPSKDSLALVFQEKMKFSPLDALSIFLQLNHSDQEHFDELVSLIDGLVVRQIPYKELLSLHHIIKKYLEKGCIPFSKETTENWIQALLEGLEPALGEELLFVLPINESVEEKLIKKRFNQLKEIKGEVSPTSFKKFFRKIFSEKPNQKNLMDTFFLHFLEEPLNQKDVKICRFLKGKPFNFFNYRKIKIASDFPSSKWIQSSDYLMAKEESPEIKEWIFFWKNLNRLKIEKEIIPSVFSLLQKTECFTASLFKGRDNDADYRKIIELTNSIQSKIPVDVDTVSSHRFFVHHLIKSKKFQSIESVLSNITDASPTFFPQNYLKTKAILAILDEIALSDLEFDYSILKTKVNKKIFSRLFDTKILTQEQLLLFIEQLDWIVTKHEDCLDLNLIQKFFTFIFSNGYVDEKKFFHRLIHRYDNLIGRFILKEKQFFTDINLSPNDKSRLCYYVLKHRNDKTGDLIDTKYRIENFISLCSFIKDDFYLNKILEEVGFLLGELILEEDQKKNGLFKESLTDIISSLNRRFSPKSYNLLFNAISRAGQQSEFLPSFIFYFNSSNIDSCIENFIYLEKMRRKDLKKKKIKELEEVLSLALNLIVSFVEIRAPSTPIKFASLVNKIKKDVFFQYIFGQHYHLFSLEFRQFAETVCLFLNPLALPKKEITDHQKELMDRKFREWELSSFYHAFYLNFFSVKQKDFVYLNNFLKFLVENHSAESFVFAQRYVSNILNSSVLVKNEKINLLIELKKYFLLSLISSHKNDPGFPEEKKLKFYRLFLKSLSFFKIPEQSLDPIRGDLLHEIKTVLFLENTSKGKIFGIESYFHFIVSEQTKLLNYYYNIFKDKDFIMSDFKDLMHHLIKDKDRDYSFNYLISLFFDLMINGNKNEENCGNSSAKSFYLSFIYNYLIESKKTLDPEKNRQEIILIDFILLNKLINNEEFFLDQWETLFQKIKNRQKQEIGIKKMIPFHIFSIWFQHQLKEEIDDFSDRKREVLFKTLDIYFDYFDDDFFCDEENVLLSNDTFFYSDLAFRWISSFLSQVFCCKKLESVKKVDYLQKLYFSFKKKGYEHFFISRRSPISYSYLTSNLPAGTLDILEVQEPENSFLHDEFSSLRSFGEVLKEFNKVKFNTISSLNPESEDLVQFFRVCNTFLENEQLWKQKQCLFYSWLQQLMGKSVASQTVAAVSVIFLIENIKNYKENKINFDLLKSAYYMFLNLIQKNPYFLEKIGLLFSEVFSQRIIETKSAKEFTSFLMWDLKDVENEDLYKQSILYGLVKFGDKKAVDYLVVQLSLEIKNLYKEENSEKKVVKIFHYLTYLGSDFSLKFAKERFIEAKQSLFLEKGIEMNFHNSVTIDFLEIQLLPPKNYDRNLLDFLPLIQHFVARQYISVANLKFITKMLCDCFNQKTNANQHLSEIFEHFDLLVYRFFRTNPTQNELSNAFTFIYDTFRHQIKMTKIRHNVFWLIKSQIFDCLDSSEWLRSSPFEGIVCVFFYLRFSRHMVRNFDLTHYFDVDVMNMLPFLSSIFLEIKTKGLEETLFITIMKEIFDSVDEFYQLSQSLCSNQEKLNEIALVSCNKAVEIVRAMEERAGDFKENFVRMVFEILQDQKNGYQSFDFSNDFLPLQNFFASKGLVLKSLEESSKLE